MKVPLFQNLRNPIYLFVTIGATLIFFDTGYYLMTSLPGEKDLTCQEGAYFTVSNIVFTAVLSIMMGLLVSGFAALISKKQKENGVALSSLSGLGFIFGGMTIFCTFCTLPVISLFGISFGLGFFTDYNLTFKILSLILLFSSAYFLNRQLKNECIMCKVNSDCEL